MQDTSNATQWIPVVNSAIVGISTILGIVVTQIWTSRRDKRAKDLEVSAQGQNQRDDFQRKTLLSLQAVLQRYARAVGAAHHHDVMAARQTGTWGQLLGNDLSQSLLDVNHRMNVLTERALDVEIRSLIARLKDLDHAALFASSQDASEAAMRTWLAHLQHVNQRIGERLRQLL